ncbi:MAG: gluconate 2-dehydrogenase subunit 3 family protein [Epsilonproteobacteria bacterium]|nr:gluconate 2-dehydrogenase subunit 3 family protein [Campylobacterota bacterium]
MTRRIFLGLSTMSVSSYAFFSFWKKVDEWEIIASVQQHLLPQSKAFPSADDVAATRYLKFVSADDSFDKEDLAFILNGARALQERSNFVDASPLEKEQILQTFTQTAFGENWLSLLLNYTLEALFSDPLYGGNRNTIGWQSFDHIPGYPRPQKRFGVVDV